MAGPLVMRSGAPSSAATIIAIVVLPRPGGPVQQHVVRRPAAAQGAGSRISESCSRTRAWPVELGEPLGSQRAFR